MQSTPWPRKVRLFFALQTQENKKVYQALLGIPFLPIFVAVMIWVWFFYNLAGLGERGKWQEWIKEHLGFVCFFATAPNVVLAYELSHYGFMRTSTYLAAGCAILSLMGPMAGMRIQKGVLAFFGAHKPASSPTCVLGCSLVFAAAFGCLHYVVSIIDPAQYSNLHGWQAALYFRVISMATVGYGDISPVGMTARWLALVEVVAGFCLLVLVVNASMTVWVQAHQPDRNVPPRDAGQEDG